MDRGGRSDHGRSAGLVTPHRSGQWSSQGKRVVEAGIAGGQNSAGDDSGYILFDGDDPGRSKGWDRQPMTDALLDGCHQVRAQSCQIAAKRDSVWFDDTNNIVDRIA